MHVLKSLLVFLAAFFTWAGACYFSQSIVVGLAVMVAGVWISLNYAISGKFMGQRKD